MPSPPCTRSSWTPTSSRAPRCEPAAQGSRSTASACDVFEAAGHPTQRTKGPGETLRHGFFFGLGHGVGLEVHEAPRLGRTGREPLIAGDVVAVEPGTVDLEHGGMRVEDLLVVTEDGAETSRPRVPTTCRRRLAGVTESWGDDPKLHALLGEQGARRFRALFDSYPDGVGLLWAIRDDAGAIVDFDFGYGNPAIMRLSACRAPRPGGTRCSRRCRPCGRRAGSTPTCASARRGRPQRRDHLRHAVRRRLHQRDQLAPHREARRRPHRLRGRRDAPAAHGGRAARLRRHGRPRPARADQRHRATGHPARAPGGGAARPGASSSSCARAPNAHASSSTGCSSTRARASCDASAWHSTR